MWSKIILTVTIKISVKANVVCVNVYVCVPGCEKEQSGNIKVTRLTNSLEY